MASRFPFRPGRLLLVTAGLLTLLPLAAATAAPPADAYADAVDAATTNLVVQPEAALGAPDGSLATVVILPGQQLVLDLGAGEEGTGNLVVTYGGLGVGVQPTVELLNASGTPVATTTLPLLDTAGGTHTATVQYSNAAAPYRFVRFHAGLSAYGIDAVAAATFRPDSDGDGLPDTWELQYGLNPLSTTNADGAAGDPDNDGLTNGQEFAAGTDPTKADTDGDGLPDGWEVTNGTDPLSATGDDGWNGDPDDDGLPNGGEAQAGTDPLEADTDGDQLPDGWEHGYGLDALDPTGDQGWSGDPDHDGLLNHEEAAAGTDPMNPDTDGDGLPDGWEVDHGLDPNSATGADGASGDPDGDGIPNSAEYAAGTDPNVPNAGRTIFLPHVTR